jgi:hypothetical protein
MIRTVSGWQANTLYALYTFVSPEGSAVEKEGLNQGGPRLLFDLLGSVFLRRNRLSRQSLT